MVAVTEMRALYSKSSRPSVLAIVLLATLVFRAYIPAGFMPASGTPFLVELCPAFEGAVPAEHAHHHHHSQGHADFQNCPFGSAPAQGPISSLFVFQPPAPADFSLATLPEPQQTSARLLRIQQPRGPPSLA
jgi:hypothetical protein